jgi:hypothetical protein
MSKAGTLSNRGDGYQTLIAIDWALTVLDDPEYQWLEVDSTLCAVDDIVVGKTDGSLIGCQCKKNHPDFKAWSIADLSDELSKAFKFLNKTPGSYVRFYSRDSFGELAKLREYSITHSDERGYCAKLPKKLQAVNSELARQMANHAPNLSPYQFITRTRFETTRDYDSLEHELRERLRRMVSSSEAVYNVLWRQIDQLGARLREGGISAVSHRLTKDELRDIVIHAGGIQAQPISSGVERKTFAATSSIGRSWRRDIGGQVIPRSVLSQLLSAIDEKQKAILLTGLPGSGKTCVMLTLQDMLEQRSKTDSSIIPLFIQSREFADLSTVEERAAQGLPGQWVENAARLAEEAHVVVVVDSLDVLSTAREHKVLAYFLGQLDRLLKMPNVTVVTACRDFDRKFDPRITGRQWDSELKCAPLDWNAEVAPLLKTLGVDIGSIESTTKELIRNPRELALFVELAQHKADCNVVTSQALARRYLDVIIKGDPTLGDEALKAIEAIAEEMLSARRLSIPHQRISIPDIIKRKLYSYNVIQETHVGELTFGHQTLLDVLVISGALRKGITLHQFIQSLSPVPFVRPCIRSFMEQLAMGSRNEYRKQIRTVLTGNAAFHIRRLVAESFAEQVPVDEDWPLLYELRNNHSEVFQAIYYQAQRVEWFYFWNKYWVPILLSQKDAEGLSLHFFRSAIWKNEAPQETLAFWATLMDLDYMDQSHLTWRLPSLLKDIDDEYLKDAVPLLERLLTLPKVEHNQLGHAVARYVSAGAIDDSRLWQYIAGDISDEDVMAYEFDNKLHCQPYEFEDREERFLEKRMMESIPLLDLALDSIEKWSWIKSSEYRVGIKYHENYLRVTSYDDKHSRHDDGPHRGSEKILFDTIEKSILNHAQTQSGWWEANATRLCFNHEGALRYFGILACTTMPQANLILIGHLLTDREILEGSLSYELGVLIKASFIYLASNIQKNIIQTILTIRQGNEPPDHWVLRDRAELIAFIPCFLRSPEAQELLDNHERVNGVLIPQPDIYSWCGMVGAPFPFDKFLSVGDGSVLRLISHYAGYARTHDDFLIGGEEEVGLELRQASSCQPIRFLRLLSANWDDISDRFRDTMMAGIATYLSYRYGDLCADEQWKPLEAPEGCILAVQIIDELERHSSYWHHNRAASSAILACSHVISDTGNAARLTFLCLGYANYHEERIDEDRDLIQTGINMVSGHIAEAIIIMANHLLENGIAFPELLPSTLLRFARSRYKAHRALLLRRLAYFQHKNYEFGWDIFHEAFKEPVGLCKHAERCLYYASDEHYDKVEPVLNQIYNEAEGKDLETWGRISALISLSGLLEQSVLLRALHDKNSADAWKGAADVWTSSDNFKRFRQQCITGIEIGLKTDVTCSTVVAREVAKLLREDDAILFIPIGLIQLLFNVLENTVKGENHYLFGIAEWLKACSLHNPEYALNAAELYLAHTAKRNFELHDYGNNFAQLITHLFAGAEEREEADNGAMLRRVVTLQDLLLAKGVDGINDWLKAAERP